MLKRLFRILLLGLSLIMLAGLIEGFRLFRYATSAHLPGAQDSALVEVGRGETPSVIATHLLESGAIGETERFLLLGRFTRAWGRLKAGEYRVSAAMTPLEILKTLESGISIPHVLTIKEGANTYEVADLLATQNLITKVALLKLARDPKFIRSIPFFAGTELPPSLEGYLFPETYHLSKTQTPEEILRQMVHTFSQHWTPEMDTQARALGMNRQKIVTLASIIEKETGAPGERPLISSVFHNRLRKKMRLQSDPTTIYGIWTHYDGNLHRRDLLAPTPYNTYTVPALPAGPIGNPGSDSLKAALYPASTEFLYFVSANDGTHYFSKTFEEHNRAVQRLQLDPKAREGKSWRDLNKKKKPDSNGE